MKGLRRRERERAEIEEKERLREIENQGQTDAETRLITATCSHTTLLAFDPAFAQAHAVCPRPTNVHRSHTQDEYEIEI